MTRIEELQAKARTGQMTPAEKLEMATLSKAVTPLSMAQAVPTKTAGEYGAAVDKAQADAMAVKPKNVESTFADAIGGAAKKGIGALDKAINGDPNLYDQDGSVTNKDVEAMKLAMPKDPYVGRPADPKDMAAYKELAESMGKQGYSNVGDTTSSQHDIYPEFPTLHEPNPTVAAPEKKTIGASFSPATSTQVASKADMVPGEKLPDVVSEKDKKSGFGDKLKELGMKYGVPLLEILQAVGYQRGGINKPTILEQKFESALAQKQQEYVDNLEAKRQEMDYARQDKATKQQQDFTANQNELNRIADKQAQGAELTNREKLALMTASQKTAEKPQESVSLKKTF